LTFDLDTQTCRRDQARLPYEFDANPFSVFRDFWFRNKKNEQKVSDGAKTEYVSV